MVTTPDFHDERVQRIADVTFDDEMGGGAVADWWDLLASVDRDLTRLTEQHVLLKAHRDEFRRDYREHLSDDPEEAALCLADFERESLAEASND